MNELLNATSTQSRALNLLATGLKPETVAASLGVTPSYISSLVSDEAFAGALATMRYEHLAKHNIRDCAYDTLEDDLLEKLKDSLGLIMRPMEMIKALQVLNQAKRRGQSAPDQLIEKQSIINLVIPIQLINKFQSNAQGQVTKVGEQELITIQSGRLDGLIKEKRDGSPALAIGNAANATG